MACEKMYFYFLAHDTKKAADPCPRQHIVEQSSQSTRIEITGDRHDNGGFTCFQNKLLR